MLGPKLCIKGYEALPLCWEIAYYSIYMKSAPPSEAPTPIEDQGFLVDAIADCLVS